MPKQDQVIFALLAATGVFLASCSAARPVAVQPTAANPPATVAPTSPLTATIAPVTPTVAPTSAAAPMATSTATTSSSPDAATLVRELLTTNAQCELPCWWGIRPGSAFTPINVAAITQVLSNTVTDDVFTISLNNSDNDVFAGLDYQVAVAVALSDTYVVEIKVHGGSPTEVPTPGWGFGKHWHEYVPHRLLTKLGVPTEVRLSAAEFAGTEAMFFTLDMSYPDKGIAVHYNGFGHKRGARYMICPVMSGDAGFDGITTVNLLLTPPGDVDGFNDSLSRWKPYKPDSTTPIQDAIGKSVAEFYDMFKNDTPDACFEPSL